MRALLYCRKGILITFEDKLVVFRLYSNYIWDKSCTTHNAVCNPVGSGLHEIIKEFDNCVL